jgi:hypothetical protein
VCGTVAAWAGWQGGTRVASSPPLQRDCIGTQKLLNDTWVVRNGGFTMAAFNVLVQWYGFRPHKSGFVPLSIAEFSL